MSQVRFLGRPVVRFYSPKFFRFSMLAILLGLGMFHWRSQKISGHLFGKVKSVEQYWADAELNSLPLEDLIQDSTCRSSERYFLACANAILSVANRFNLIFTTQGEFRSADADSSTQMVSEKKQLQVWKDFFYQEHEQPNISFSKSWTVLQRNYISDRQKPYMVGLGLNGFISVFRDPHTYLVPVALFKEVISKTDNQINSLGITISKSENQYVIRKVLDGSPANKAGLRRGDKIIEVNGQKVSGLLQVRLVELFKGDVGTKATLKVFRRNEKLSFDLVHNEIKVATVSTRVIDGIKPIAIIGINKFAKGSCEKIKESLTMIKKAQVRGLLLDLRDNPGGQMEEAACVASLFLGADKKIFEIRYLDTAKKPEVFFGGEDKVFEKPMAVLINAGSASASEIVAGALQDFKRAVLVGERSFGKGSFQEGEYWAQNKKIALFETKGFYYLPSGRSPQLVGLSPDVNVKFDNFSFGREADQFMHPLDAPVRKSSYSKSIISTEDCLNLDDPNSSEDVQILKASQVLFCGKTVAGVGP